MSTRACESCGREAGFHVAGCVAAKLDKLQHAAAEAYLAAMEYAQGAVSPWVRGLVREAERFVQSIAFVGDDEMRRIKEENCDK